MAHREIEIRRYTPADSTALFAMLRREGAEWVDYWGPAGRPKYESALCSSIVYLLFEGEALCGYARCRDDDGFGLYVYDLLVDRAYRGNAYGRRLMEQAYYDHPGAPVYVMSDVNAYYEKLGYETEGTIFIVRPQL